MIYLFFFFFFLPSYIPYFQRRSSEKRISLIPLHFLEEKSERKRMESEDKLWMLFVISILVSLVIPLMDIQFRVSSLDRSLIVKDRRFEKLDNGSIMRRKFGEIENLEDRLLHRDR